MLVIALLLLVIAGAMLAVVARQSLGRAAEAVRGERALQAKWATLSLDRSLPPRAESIMGRADRATLATTLDFGDGPSRQRVRVVVGDESAKYNLNLLADRGAGSVDEAVRQLTPGSRPAVLSTTNFTSFGEIFDAPTPADLLGATRDLTIFGDGRLRLDRASPAAVERVTRGVVAPGVGTRLAELRRERPNEAITSLYAELGLSRRDRELLSSVLALESTAHSVWVLPEAGEARLFVVERPPGEDVRRRQFSW